METFEIIIITIITAIIAGAIIFCSISLYRYSKNKDQKEVHNRLFDDMNHLSVFCVIACALSVLLITVSAFIF